MRFIAAIVITTLAVVALGYVAYTQYPREVVTAHTGFKMVTEQQTRTVTKRVEVQGEMIEVDVEVEGTVTRPVPETITRVALPTIWHHLCFWLVAFVAALFGLYSLVTLVVFARDKWQMKPDSAGTRDTRQRIDNVISFSLGVLVTFVAIVVGPLVTQSLSAAPAGNGFQEEAPHGESDLRPSDPPPGWPVIE